MTVIIHQTDLNEGDALTPQDNDILTQFGRLDAGLPLPEDDGWRVMTGNAFSSLVARVVYRHELEEDEI